MTFLRIECKNDAQILLNISKQFLTPFMILNIFLDQDPERKAAK